MDKGFLRPRCNNSSLDRSGHSVATDQNGASLNETENAYDDQSRTEDANHHEGVNKLMNFDLKPDSYIVNNPGLNEMYKVVERPKFLLLFDNKEDESKYLLHRLHKNYSQEVSQQVCKAVVDVALMEALCWVFLTGGPAARAPGLKHTYFAIFVGMAVLLAFNIIVVNGRLSYQWTGLWSLFQFVSVLFSCVLFLLVGPQFLNFLSRDAQMATLTVYQTIIQTSYVLPFRVFALM